MTADDILSLLSAGLDRDEQLARRAAPEWWVAIDDSETAGALGGINFEHVERHAPTRALRQVEAIRKPVEVYRAKAAELEAAVHDEDKTYAAYSEGYRDACRMFVGALASIYGDPAETGGES